MEQFHRRRGGIGVFLLIIQMLQIGFQHIPPVTLCTALFQTVIFLRLFKPPWDGYDVCISGHAILYYKEYYRLFVSALEHMNDLHLYHNMVSFIVKGRTIENLFGSRKFLLLLLSFTAACSAVYCLLAKVAFEFFEDYSYMKQCAVGFSGVVFALKVLTTHYGSRESHYLHGFVIPSKYAVWVELIVIHVLVPNSSFMGHLAGILVGIFYIGGPLRLLVDVADDILGSILGPPRVQERYYHSYTYSHGTAADWSEEHSEPDPNYEELRQRRMNRFL